MTFNFTVKEFIIGNGTPTLQFYKKGFNLGDTGSQPSWQDIILSGNTALTLTNALADGLNYVKLFGGTEQRNIPSEYTQVEYLQSTDTQYINTGVVPKTSLSVKIKYNILQLASSNNIAIFGSISSQTGLFSGLASNPLVYYINSGAEAVSSIPFALNTIREEEYINNTMIRSDVTYTTNPIVANDIPMALFGRNTGSEIARIGTLRIYYFALYDNGVLIQNLVPAKRNSDNVLGMYDTVTGNFLTNSGTGSFTAGANVTVPTPDIPMDIVSNNGVVKVSKNLFDVNNVETQADTSIGSDGSFVANPATKVCITYLPVKPNTRYTISGDVLGSSTVFFRLAEYTSSKQFITRGEGIVGSSYTFTTGANTYFVRFHCLTDANLNTYQLELGSTATPYMPYGQIYTDGTVETVEIHGKNLFDKNDRGLGDGYISASTGAVVGTGRGHTGYFKVKPNTTYHVTLDEYQQGSTNGIAYYDNDKNFVVGKASGTSYGNPPYNFTVPDNNSIVYARLTLTNNIASTNLNVIQIELGSTATTYEAYFNGGQATAENLFKVGTYQDVQSVIDGGVTRNVGVKVLDGTEDWIESSTVGKFNSQHLLNGADGRIIQNTICFCTHFLGVVPSISLVNMEDLTCKAGWISGSTNFDSLYITYAKYENNLVGFKQFLADQYNAGQPVVIVYPKATPTTESVTGQPLTTQAGTNIVEITQASINNLGLEVSYKATI